MSTAGALTALSLTLQLFSFRQISTADVVRTFYLTRDHLKIMRNALEDIDPPARERDMAYRDHGTHLLFEKWASATHRHVPDRSARVVVPDFQLSLAIGKEGQNARLAAKLTGWRIDIRPDTEAGAGAAPRSGAKAASEDR